MNRKQRRRASKLGQIPSNPAAETGTVAVPPADASLLGVGLKHHQAGRLAEAEACYRRVAQTLANKATAELYYYDLLAANNVSVTPTSEHAAMAGVTYDPATVLASEATTNAFVQSALNASGASARVATVGLLESLQSLHLAA